MDNESAKSGESSVGISKTEELQTTNLPLEVSPLLADYLKDCPTLKGICMTATYTFHPRRCG